MIGTRLILETEINKFLDGKNNADIDILAMPVELAGSEYWETMNTERRDRILGGMLRNTVRRAIENVPLYKQDSRWKNVNPKTIISIKDLAKLPPISKDSVSGTGTPDKQGIRGFRASAIKDPMILVPQNINELIKIQESANPNHKKILEKYHGKKILSFSSGGSQGRATTTLLSYLTVEMEAWALARSLKKNGLLSGMSIACFYNDTHKGGLQLERAADIMGMEFHSKKKIFSELAAHPKYKPIIQGFQQALLKNHQTEMEKYGVETRKAIREYIQQNKIKIIESVQPPKEFSNSNAKGNALAFMKIYEEDPSAFKSVEHIFLTGFPVPEEAYSRLKKDKIKVSTTWGATEAMALATSEEAKTDDVNNLTATPFPTVGMVAWYKERNNPTPQLKEVEVNSEGALYVTSLIGCGSTYINYRIGDKSTRTEKGFKGINRSMRVDIGGSCAADALLI